MIMPVCML